MEEMLNSREKQESKLYALIAGAFSYFLVINALHTLNVYIAENYVWQSVISGIIDLLYTIVFTVALLIAKSRIPFVALTGFSMIYSFANIDFDQIRSHTSLTTICNILSYVAILMLLVYCIIACVEKQNKISPSTMRAMCLGVIIIYLVYYLLVFVNYLLSQVKLYETLSAIGYFFVIEILIMVLVYGRTVFLCLWMSPYNDQEDVVYDREKQLGYVKMYRHVFYLIFTCGIWELIWIYRTTKALNECRDEYDKERDPLTCVLLSMFIPFYYLYWLYKTCRRIEKKAEKQGDYCSIAVLCVVLTFIIGIIPPILVQTKLNDIAKKAYIIESEQNDGVEIKASQTQI